MRNGLKRFSAAVLAAALIAALFTGVSFAAGVTMRVDPSTGNDSSQRAEGAVYKTLEKALASAVSGDTIEIKGTVGSASAGNTNQTYQVNAGVTVRGLSGSAVYGRFVVNASNVTLDNLAVTQNVDMSSETVIVSAGAANVAITGGSYTRTYSQGSGVVTYAGNNGAVTIRNATMNGSVAVRSLSGALTITGNTIISSQIGVTVGFSAGAYTPETAKALAGVSAADIAAANTIFVADSSLSGTGTNYYQVAYESAYASAGRFESAVANSNQLTYMLTNTMSGGKITLMTGNYTGNYNVVMPVTITGVGATIGGTLNVNSSNVTVDGLTFSVPSGAAAVTLSSSLYKNLSVKNCTFAPASSGALSAVVVKTSSGASGSAAELTGNKFTGSYSDGAIVADIGSGSMYITNNNISVSTGYAVVRKTTNGAGGTVSAANNYWGSASPSFASLISGDVAHEPYYQTADMNQTSGGATGDVTRNQMKKLADYAATLTSSSDADRRFTYQTLQALRTAVTNANSAYSSGTTTSYETVYTALDSAICALTVQNYAVTTVVTNNLGGSITPYSPLAPYGRALTFTLLPSAGYRVKSVTVNGSAVTPSNNAFTATVTSSMYIAVEFEKASYTVTFPSGITASAKYGSALSSGASVAYGTVVTFTATERSGAKIQRVEYSMDGVLTPVVMGGSSFVFDVTVTAPVQVNLYTSASVDKAQLYTAIASARAKDPVEQYTTNTAYISSFNQALGTAEDILTLATATQTQVNDAATALSNASAVIGSARRAVTVYAIADAYVTVTPNVATTISYGGTATITANVNSAYVTTREIKYASANGEIIYPTQVYSSGNLTTRATFDVTNITEDTRVTVYTGSVSSSAAASLKASVQVISLTPADITTYNYSTVIPSSSTIDQYINTFNGSTLTDADRAGLADEYARLLALQTAFSGAKAASEVISSVNSLPAVASMTTDNKAAVISAYNAYTALSTSARSFVPLETANKILNAVEYIAPLTSNGSTVAEQFTSIMKSLPEASGVTSANAATVAISVQEAQLLYAELTTSEKQKVGAETYQKLLDLAVKVETLDTASADSVAAKIKPGALSAVTSVDTYETAGAKRVAIYAAKAACDRLTQSQRALLPAESLANLAACVESAGASAEYYDPEYDETISVSSVMSGSAALTVTSSGLYGVDVESIINQQINGSTKNSGKAVSRAYNLTVTDYGATMTRPKAYLEVKIELTYEEYLANPRAFAYSQGYRAAYELASAVTTSGGKYYISFSAPGAGDYAVACDAASGGKKTVTFNPNGGKTSALSMTVTAPATTLGTVPFAAKSGYIFKSWNTKADGSGTQLTSTTAVTADTTVYAVWEYVWSKGSGSAAGLGGTTEAPTLALGSDGTASFDASGLASAKSLKITSSDGQYSASLDSTAVNTLRAQSGTIAVTFAKGAESAMGDYYSGIIESHPVYKFAITAAGKTVTELKGDVRFSIPYTIGAAEDVNALVVIAGDGKGNDDDEILRDCNFDKTARTMDFVTNEIPGYFAIGCNKQTFTDTSSSWAKDQITFLAARDIVVGKGSGRFAPTDTLTRSEFLRMLFGCVNGIDTSAAAEAKNYTDVQQNQWYADTINYAVAKSILPALTGTTYGPLEVITREQMAVAIYNFMSLVGIELDDTVAAVSFPDISSASAAAQTAIKKMQTAGILAGKSTNGKVTFDPQGKLTRAEACQVIRAIILSYIGD